MSEMGEKVIVFGLLAKRIEMQDIALVEFP